MEPEMIIVIVLVIASIIGLLIVIRPHPIKVVKKQSPTSHTNDMHGWGLNE